MKSLLILRIIKTGKHEVYIESNKIHVKVFYGFNSYSKYY